MEKEQFDYIRKNYKSKTYKEIADALGVELKDVNNWVQRMIYSGVIPPKHRNQHWKPEYENVMAEIWSKEIANTEKISLAIKATGCSEATIKDKLTKLRRAGKVGKSRNITQCRHDAIADAVAEDWKSGMKTSKMVLKYNVTPWMIRHIAKKKGALRPNKTNK